MLKCFLIFFWIFHSARKVCTAHLCVCRDRNTKRWYSKTNIAIYNIVFKNIQAKKKKAEPNLKAYRFNVIAVILGVGFGLHCWYAWHIG
jgi:hypothetical protein